MIHQPRRLPRATRLLSDIVALQIAALDVAAMYDANTIRDATQFTENLADYLDSRRRFRTRHDRAEQMAKWIARKPTLLEHLAEFAMGDPEERIDFVDGVKHDINLLYHPRPRRLQIAIRSKEPDWRWGARQFLYRFYGIWRDSGFDSDLFTLPVSGKYTRQNFLEEFGVENPNLVICPVCDGSTYRKRAADHIYASLEHFFPRGVYPHFSCHPFNLIPICTICNSYIKRAADAQRIDTIGDFVLPYQKTSLSQVAYVDIGPRPDGHESGEEHPLAISIRSAKQQGDRVAHQIDVFNALYKVEESWNGGFEQIEQQVFRRMSQFLILDLALGDTVSDSEQVKQKLELLMALTNRDNLGRDPFAFCTTWVLKHYVDQLENEVENAPVYVALKEWSKSRASGWQELRKIADSIHNRVLEMQE